MRYAFFLSAIFLNCLSPLLYCAEEIPSPSEMIINKNEEEDKPVAIKDTIDETKLIAANDNTVSGFVSPGPEEEDFVDPRVLRDFVESRGLISCRQKEGCLTIAGDVRARWIGAAETVDGKRVRGAGTGTPINRFRSEVNLFFDYAAPRSWLTTKLKFFNFLGRDGGTATTVNVERAFIGFDIASEGDNDFYIEAGRTPLDYLFESRVEFSSTFDGIHFFYTQCIPTLGQFTIHGGPFIVDAETNHYAWVIEAFITKWRGTGLALKYSIIDWRRRGTTRFFGAIPAPHKTIRDNPRFQFLVSQMLFGYERQIDFLRCKTLFLYAAVLMNHDAKRHAQTDFKKLNGAWYVGFTLGKLCKACDWSIDINYQSVQAQAVPEFDLSGIGHGNANGGLLSDAIIQGLPLAKVRLFTNFKGWEANALYAMTDSLSLRAKAQHSVPRNKGIGGNTFTFRSFEMAVIYAF